MDAYVAQLRNRDVKGSNIATATQAASSWLKILNDRDADPSWRACCSAEINASRTLFIQGVKYEMKLDRDAEAQMSGCAAPVIVLL